MELALYTVWKSIGCSFISINSAWNFLFRFGQRCGKDLLIWGRAQFLTKSICSIGHIERAWHRLKACWGWEHAPGAPLVSVPMDLTAFTLFSHASSEEGVGEVSSEPSLAEMFEQIRNCRYIRHYYPDGTALEEEYYWLCNGRLNNYTFILYTEDIRWMKQLSFSLVLSVFYLTCVLYLTYMSNFVCFVRWLIWVYIYFVRCLRVQQIWTASHRWHENFYHPPGGARQKIINSSRAYQF